MSESSSQQRGAHKDHFVILVLVSVDPSSHRLSHDTLFGDSPYELLFHCSFFFRHQEDNSVASSGAAAAAPLFGSGILNLLDKGSSDGNPSWAKDDSDKSKKKKAAGSSPKTAVSYGSTDRETG